MLPTNSHWHQQAQHNHQAQQPPNFHQQHQRGPDQQNPHHMETMEVEEVPWNQFYPDYSHQGRREPIEHTQEPQQNQPQNADNQQEQRRRKMPPQHLMEQIVNRREQEDLLQREEQRQQRNRPQHQHQNQQPQLPTEAPPPPQQNRHIPNPIHQNGQEQQNYPHHTHHQHTVQTNVPPLSLQMENQGQVFQQHPQLLSGQVYPMQRGPQQLVQDAQQYEMPQYQYPQWANQQMVFQRNQHDMIMGNGAAMPTQRLINHVSQRFALPAERVQHRHEPYAVGRNRQSRAAKQPHPQQPVQHQPTCQQCKEKDKTIKAQEEQLNESAGKLQAKEEEVEDWKKYSAQQQTEILRLKLLANSLNNQVHLLQGHITPPDSVPLEQAQFPVKKEPLDEDQIQPLHHAPISEPQAKHLKAFFSQHNIKFELVPGPKNTPKRVVENIPIGGFQNGGMVKEFVKRNFPYFHLYEFSKLFRKNFFNTGRFQVLGQPVERIKRVDFFYNQLPHKFKSDYKLLTIEEKKYFKTLQTVLKEMQDAQEGIGLISFIKTGTTAYNNLKEGEIVLD